MDELGTDTTKRRGRVITSSSKKLDTWLFQITPEGDGHMNIHVTVCLTTRSDGKWWLVVVGRGGGNFLPLPVVVVFCR